MKRGGARWGDLFDHKAVVKPDEAEEHPLLAALREVQPDEIK